METLGSSVGYKLSPLFVFSLLLAPFAWKASSLGSTQAVTSSLQPTDMLFTSLACRGICLPTGHLSCDEQKRLRHCVCCIRRAQGQREREPGAAAEHTEDLSRRPWWCGRLGVERCRFGSHSRAHASDYRAAGGAAAGERCGSQDRVCPATPELGHHHHRHHAAVASERECVCGCEREAQRFCPPSAHKLHCGRAERLRRGVPFCRR